MKLLIMGAQGSGKGTQCEQLTKLYNIPAISTGDMFRNIIASGNELGKKVKSIIDAGNLVPDDITLEVLKDRLKKSDCKNGFILDGFPRTIEQAHLLEKITKIDKVIFLDVDYNIVIDRITSRRTCPKCGHIHNIHFAGSPDICSECGEKYIVRSDDTEEAIKKRLDTFNKKTLPIVDYYKKQGLVLSVDASVDPKHILDQIVKGLAK